MLLPLILAALALATVVLSPALLALRPWQLRRPRTALTLWFASFALGMALAAAAVGSTILIALASSGHSTATDALAAPLSAWVLLGLMGAVIGLVLTAAGSSGWEANHRADLALSRQEKDGFTLVRFHGSRPDAYAIPGPHPEIFLSSDLEERLTGPELTAVIAHEYAHLRQRHFTALRIAELNAVCVPFLPAGRALSRTTRLLVELAADDAAARQVGPAHLANALSRLSEASGDAGMAVRAERLADKRWPVSRRRRLPRPLRTAVEEPAA